ncbi:MAG: hypothetical protein R6V57_00625 [Vicinamibacterales bacterium]
MIRPTGWLVGAAVLNAAASVLARPFIEAGRRRLHLCGRLNRHPPEGP